MTIHHKACTRCRGDLDATLPDDVRCVQCGHRRYAPPPAGSAGVPARRGGGTRARCPRSQCPRCRSGELVALDRLSPEHNLCVRCRLCGHIFSPPGTE